eukprot:SAG31_NODE_25558_length_459_cov_0.713889_1_plen_54_part_10
MAAKRAYYRRLDRNSLMASQIKKLTADLETMQQREALLEAAVRRAGLDPTLLVN